MALRRVTTLKRKNGEGTIYFNSERNVWIAQFYYVSIDNVLKRKSVSGKSQNEVIVKKNNFLKDNVLGLIPSESKQTLSQILKNDIEREFSLNLIKEPTYQRKLYTFSIIDKETIAHIPIPNISEQNIFDFLSILPNYANSTISKVYALLNKGFKLACEENIISKNPLDKTYIRQPKSSKPDKKIRALTVSEQNILISAIKMYKPKTNCPDYSLQILLALFTGMRIGEINALKANDIDFKNNIIHIRRTITRGIDYQTIISNSTKTETGRRDIPLNKFAKQTIIKAINVSTRNKDGLIFYNNKKDCPVSASQVNCAFKRLCAKTDIDDEEGINIHMLRHTFATRCIESGIPAEVLQKWLGHRDIKTTINTYCDIFSSMHNYAIEKFVNYTQDISLVEHLFMAS